MKWQLLRKLQKSCQTGDWESAANHAHNISSSSETFGCEALSKIAMQLEKESENSNIGECISLASQLPQVFLKSQQNLYEIFCRVDIQ